MRCTRPPLGSVFPVSSAPSLIRQMSSLSRKSRPLEPPPDLSPWIVKLSDHYCDGGGYGDVWKCLYNRDSESKEVAVKALRFQFMPAARESDSDDKYVKIARRELGIWRRLSHTSIVPFLGIAYGFGPHVALVSLWMPHGTLRTFLAAHDDKLAISHRLKLLLDIANGLLYLHSQPFVHGDLTSNNVLIDETYCARLADFGLASLVGEIPEGMAYLHASTMRTGTVRWAAPEYFSQEADKVFQRTTKTDIYSFGHIIFQVLSGKEPWSDIREDFRVVLCLSQGQRPARPLSPPIDDLHWDLIQSCWGTVNERPTADNVVLVLRSCLASCPTKAPLKELLQSPQITLQDITRNQENHMEHKMHHLNLSEDYANDPEMLSQSHITESLIAERAAQLEMISERRKTLLSEMFRMLQRRDNAGSVLTLDDIEDQDEKLKRFLTKFDIMKNPESSITSDLPDSELLIPSHLSSSEAIAKQVEGLAELDVDYPMSDPSASSANISPPVWPEDEEEVLVTGFTELSEAAEALNSYLCRPQTPWASPVFMYSTLPSKSTPFIPPAPAGVKATTVTHPGGPFASSYDPGFSAFPHSENTSINYGDFRSIGEIMGHYPTRSQGPHYPPPPWVSSRSIPSQWRGFEQKTRHDGSTLHTVGPEHEWRFAEGPDYGPVLEPFLIKVVGASVNVNPLLTPPSSTHEDYLRWNMLFHTTNCYRTSESVRSWKKGRKEPATHPRVTSIRLISRSFPWMILVRAQNPEVGVTCEDVLDAICKQMYCTAEKEDFDSMSMPMKRQVWGSYYFNRSSDSTVPGQRLGEAMRRIDWLGHATRFGGLVVDDGFVKERCGDALPCIFELKCVTMYPMTTGERAEVPYWSSETAEGQSWLPAISRSCIGDGSAEAEDPGSSSKAILSAPLG